MLFAAHDDVAGVNRKRGRNGGQVKAQKDKPNEPGRLVPETPLSLSAVGLNVSFFVFFFPLRVECLARAIPRHGHLTEQTPQKKYPTTTGSKLVAEEKTPAAKGKKRIAGLKKNAHKGGKRKQQEEDN